MDCLPYGLLLASLPMVEVIRGIPQASVRPVAREQRC